MTFNEQQQLELCITILKGILSNQGTSTTTTTEYKNEYPNSTGTFNKQDYTKTTS